MQIQERKKLKEVSRIPNVSTSPHNCALVKAHTSSQRKNPDKIQENFFGG